jgi:hypothetical protein
MPTAEQKDRVKTITMYVFFAAMAAGLSSAVFMAITRDGHTGARIIITSIWLLFATVNFRTFYTGTMRFKGGQSVNREQSPILFYIAAIFWCIGSMSMATLGLWMAYTHK